MQALALRQARLLGRDGLWDVVVERGRVTAVAPSAAAPAAEELDLEGRLLLPGFVDSHVHLDKAYLDHSAELRGQVGAAFFTALRAFKRAASSADIKRRMRRALEAASAHGTTALRAQVDVDDVVELRGLEAALALREECADWITLQVLVFPQEGVAGNPRAGAFVREALDMGADLLGGGAVFDPVEPRRHWEALFELAVRYDRDLDLHTDIGTSPSQPLEQWDLATVARLTREAGWQGRVTVAHLAQLGQMAPAEAEALAELLVEAGINVTVVPAAELNTARRWGPQPAKRVEQAMADLELLVRTGVNLSYSTGHLEDSFNPYGKADLLLDGLVLACARNLGDPWIAGTHVLRLGTEAPARALRLPGPHGVEVGAIADLVVLDASDPDLALRQQAERWLVLKRGRPVARSHRVTERLWLATAGA